MKKWKKALLTLALLISFVIAVPVTGLAAAKYYVTTATVNVRSGPGTNYRRVLLLPKKEAVKVTGSTKYWYKVEYQNYYQQKYRGYISKNYLKSADIYKTLASLNLRRGTSTNTGKATTIPKGAKVIITDTYTGDWYRTVYYASNGNVYRGYTHQNYLRKNGAKKGNYITTDDVYMHRKPSMTSTNILVVPKGCTVKVTKMTNGKWYYCTYKSSKGRTYKGYISNVCLKKK